MKHLKSSLQDLRELFDQKITIKYIAEPFTSFDADCSAATVQVFMEQKDYDVVGIRQDGLISGYVNKDALSSGRLADYLKCFSPGELVLDTTPIVEVFEKLRQIPRAFVFVFGQVGGIVTKGDLNKSPVRMWLFVLISLIEMQLLRIIREFYPDDSWKPSLSEKKLNDAKIILADRQKRNEAVDLADCLQFGDKRDIVLKGNKIWSLINSMSKNKVEKLLKDLENIRNNLAHAQDIITGNWPYIVDLTSDAEKFLSKIEKVTNKT